MKRFTHIAAAALALGAVYAGVSLAVPGWTTQIGMDFWNAPGLQDSLDAENKRSQTLSDQDKTVLRRLRIKDEITQDVIEGRTTLFEAAAMFRTMNASRPHFIELLKSRFPDCEENEVHCLNVIEFVTVQSAQQSSASSDIVAQLYAQLLAHKAQNAGCVLLVAN